MKLFTYILVIFCGITAAQAQPENTAIRNGNKFYKQGQYDKALPEYQKALQQNPKSATANYNIGNTQFRHNDYAAAEKAFDDAIADADNNTDKEKSQYNKGVTYSKQKKLMESIDAWKKALMIDANDSDARFNLQKALLELKKQNEENKKDQPQPQKQQKQQQQKQEKPKPPSKLDKKKIEQYLQSLQQKEQEVQRKLQQNRARSVTQPDKDW